MECSEMSIPLDVNKFNSMIKWLDIEREMCQERSIQMIRDAKSAGTKFEEKFEEDKMVQSYKTNMKFLIDHQVLL